MINVFGHTNPDSDSVCTAVVTAWWLSFQGRLAVPWCPGIINRETRFIFRQAQLSTPDLLPSELPVEDVWLVDFTEPSQGPAWLSDSNVVGVIDHHRLGGLMTRMPPEVWISPIGSSATLLWQLMDKDSRSALPPSHAILLIGAIISDTVALKSATTTSQDVRAMAELRAVAGIDIDAFTRDVLLAKTDIHGLSITELIHKDLKHFTIGGKQVLISQIEIAAQEQIQPLLNDLCLALTSLSIDKTADLSVLMATDITLSSSTIYFCGPSSEAFSSCSFPGMLSRKKQLLPWLDEQLRA